MERGLPWWMSLESCFEWPDGDFPRILSNIVVDRLVVDSLKIRFCWSRVVSSKVRGCADARFYISMDKN